ADEFAPRQRQGDVPQIVLPRTPDHDVPRAHPWLSPKRKTGREIRLQCGSSDPLAEPETGCARCALSHPESPCPKHFNPLPAQPGVTYYTRVAVGCLSRPDRDSDFRSEGR